MNRENRAVLIGLALGDGYIRKTFHKQKDGKMSTYFEYKAGHSIKQIEYAKHKAKLLKKLLGLKDEPKIHKTSTTLKSNGKTYETVEVRKQHKIFGYIHNVLYVKGKKVITKRMLEMLNPEAIAIWMMDDGGCYKNTNAQGKVTSCQSRLHTYCTREEAELIVDYFKETYGISGFLAKYNAKSGETQWNVRFNSTASKQISALIQPYMIPLFEYKINPHWHECVAPLEGDDIVRYPNESRGASLNG